MAKSRILWVDDDLFFYTSYRDELKEICQVEVASSPEAMWKSLHSRAPDGYSGIILDVLLPFGEMDIETTNGGLRTGLALLEQIKATEFKSVPVIIFTIRESADVDEVGRKYGVRVFRKSEVRISEFVNAVRKDFGI